MAIRLPQKPRPGYHSINELTRAINGLIDYVSSFSITGKKPIHVVSDMFKTEISIKNEQDNNTPTPSNPNSGYHIYSGWFKVSVDDDSVRISDGGDSDADYAGYAFYNAVAVHCRSYNLPAEKGFLCLRISYDSDYHVSYGFSDTVSNMPKLEDIGGDNTAEYPLALISEGEDGWNIQQLCYGIPQLWCFGPCDTEEAEEEE